MGENPDLMILLLQVFLWNNHRADTEQEREEETETRGADHHENFLQLIVRLSPY